MMTLREFAKHLLENLPTYVLDTEIAYVDVSYPSKDGGNLEVKVCPDTGHVEITTGY